MIRYHSWFPGFYDPFFQYNMPQNTERIDFYGFDYTPHFRIDGIIDGAYGTDAWNGLIVDRINIESPFTVNISGNFDEIGRTGELNIMIYCESIPSVSDLKLRVALTESDIFWEAPNGSIIHNQTFRYMIPNTAGESFSINQGDTQQFTYQFEIQSLLVPENCEFVAFIQSDQNGEILQGGKIGIPDLMPLDISEKPMIPGDYNLKQNYPNPFNSSTAIEFRILDGEIDLKVYNIAGSMVRTLVDGYLEAGSHSMVWDGKNDNGAEVSSGIYFYRLKHSGGENVLRMTLLK